MACHGPCSLEPIYLQADRADAAARAVSGVAEEEARVRAMRDPRPPGGRRSANRPEAFLRKFCWTHAARVDFDGTRFMT